MLPRFLFLAALVNACGGTDPGAGPDPFAGAAGLQAGGGAAVAGSGGADASTAGAAQGGGQQAGTSGSMAEGGASGAQQAGATSGGMPSAGTGGSQAGAATGGGGTQQGGSGGAPSDPLEPKPAPGCPGYVDVFVPEQTCIWIHGGTFTMQNASCDVIDPLAQTCATVTALPKDSQGHGPRTVRLSAGATFERADVLEGTATCPKACN